MRGKSTPSPLSTGYEARSLGSSPHAAGNTTRRNLKMGIRSYQPMTSASSTTSTPAETSHHQRKLQLVNNPNQYPVYQLQRTFDFEQHQRPVCLFEGWQQFAYSQTQNPIYYQERHKQFFYNPNQNPMPFYGRQQLLAYNPNQQQMVTYPRRALENGNLPLDNQINESPSYLRNPDSFKPDIVNQIHQEFKLIYVWQITDYSYKEDYLFHLRDQKSCYVSSEVITNYGHKLCFVMEMNTFNDKTQSYWASIYAAFIRPREQYDQQVRYDIDFIVLNGNSEAVKRKARPPEQYLNGSLLSFVPGARRGGLWLGSEIGLWKNQRFPQTLIVCFSVGSEGVPQPLKIVPYREILTNCIKISLISLQLILASSGLQPFNTRGFKS